MKSCVNYKIYVGIWEGDRAERLDEAFEKATKWVAAGYKDVVIVEVATGMRMKHNPSRKDRF